MALFAGVTCTTVLPEEEARLNKPSGFHCPECAEPMCVGDYEAAGLCTDCYFDVVTHP